MPDRGEHSVPKRGGLEGVVVGETRLSYVDGQRGRLGYAGLPIEILAEHATFEEVAFLLWKGRLPVSAELEELQRDLASRRSWPAKAWALLESTLGGESPMASLRAALAVLAVSDSKTPPAGDRAEEDGAALHEKIRDLTARTAMSVAALARIRRGETPEAPRRQGRHTEELWRLLQGGEPDPDDVRVLEKALILHMDHGLNASTFALRVATSCGCDLHAAVAAALATLAGPLHGGASTAVLHMLKEVGEPERAEAWVQARLANRQRVMGFGHRVYRGQDPRAKILQTLSQEVADRKGEHRMHDVAVAIDQAMTNIREQGGKPLHPNVDFYAATTYQQLGIEGELFPCLFALARVPAWGAHHIEQKSAQRALHPRARYVGPQELSWVPLSQRTTELPPAPAGPPWEA